jgi:spermidine/putrescine-binding protein
VEGTAILHNYAGWMGKDNIKHFRAQYPGANIKQVTAGDISSSATAQTLKANPDAYDFALGDQAFVGQALAADIIQDVDFDKVPNIANVDAKFHEAFSHGVPTDYGKVGIGYRKDMVSEPIASWADLWSLAPKYSGKIVFLDFDRDTIGSALRYKGFSGNTQDESELEQAKQALIDIKPHLLAIKGYDVAASLVKGDAAIVMDWDYDVALGQGQDPNIEWVLPEEGAMAYLEGWSVIKGTDNVDLVHAFMNFFLQPKEYADFVNTTGTAYVMDAATPYINASISKNSALIVDPATLEKVEFENFLGEATALYSKAWDEFKSA